MLIELSSPRLTLFASLLPWPWPLPCGIDVYQYIRINKPFSIRFGGICTCHTSASPTRESVQSNAAQCDTLKSQQKAYPVSQDSRNWVEATRKSSSKPCTLPVCMSVCVYKWGRRICPELCASLYLGTCCSSFKSFVCTFVAGILKYFPCQMPAWLLLFALLSQSPLGGPLIPYPHPNAPPILQCVWPQYDCCCIYSIYVYI